MGARRAPPLQPGRHATRGERAGQPAGGGHLDADDDGDDVVSLEGEARIVRARAAVADVPPAYVEKYAAKLAAFGWTMESMLVDYPVEIRVRVTRARVW